MIPIGGIIGASAALRGRGGYQKGDARVAGIVLLRFLVFPLLISFTGGFVGPTVTGTLLLLYTVTWFPYLILKYILVPLRLSRAAYFFARIVTPIVFARSPTATGALFGMLAAMRSPQIDLSRVAWLEAKMQLEPVRSEALLVRGLIAFVRKDNELAYELFAAVTAIAYSAAPRLVLRTAHEWMIAYAAERGEWAHAAKIGVRTSYRWTMEVRWIARRLAKEPNSPSDFALWFAWLWAPRRIATFPLLRRALAMPRHRVGPEPEPAIEPLDGGPPIEVALAAHAECLRSNGASLPRAAVAWDAARNDPATLALLARRALALSATLAPESALLRAMSAAEDDLAACLANGIAPSSIASETYFTVTSRLRSEQLLEVEHLAAAMRRRTIDQQDLPPMDEWLEWSRLRAAAERALAGGDASTRRAVFEAIYLPVCNHGVRLFNVRKQGILGNAMFRWLLTLTTKDEHPAAFVLLTKNSRSPYI